MLLPDLIDDPLKQLEQVISALILLIISSAVAAFAVPALSIATPNAINNLFISLFSINPSVLDLSQFPCYALWNSFHYVELPNCTGKNFVWCGHPHRCGWPR